MHGLCLWHACYLGDVGVGSISISVSIHSCLWMVYHQQIAVAHDVGTVLCLTLAMTIVGMTGNTAVTCPRGAQTFAWCLGDGIEVFKIVFALVETLFHARHIQHGRCSC